MSCLKPITVKLPLLVILLTSPSAVHADPQISSWFTTNSGQYARIYESSGAETAGTQSTTWSRGAGTQSSPTYADVSEIASSAKWVYIRTSGLASHLMGPWPTTFPNFPSNTATIYRIPRVPTVPVTKTQTGGGPIGRFVNGVSFFDNRDAFSYVNATATEAQNTGDGIWNRDAYVNEAASFDPALAHQAGNDYHYHVQPIALRYQLGDHVNYNATTNRYSESSGAVTSHSPILAWAADGFPIYGPYGYSDPTSATSGVRRMVAGYTPRNGSNGTTNLTSTGRRSLPAWAATAQGRSSTLTSSQYGPAVSTTYPLGRYLEDNDFRGDLGYTQTTGATVRDFDLDKYNGRTCVTPEFPAGTFAYFSTLNADGTPAFPYNIGRQYYGSITSAGATTAAIMNADTPLTTHFSGGPNKTASWPASPVAKSGNTVTVSWSAVEGGTYQVQQSADLATWNNVTPTVTATGSDSAQLTETVSTGTAQRFYRTNRTALAAFDANGFNYTQAGGGGKSVAPGGSATRGTTVTILITLPTSPPLPPADLIPQSITLAGSIVGSSITRPSQQTAQVTMVIPAGAPSGAQNLVIVFNPNPTYTLTAGFTLN